LNLLIVASRFPSHIRGGDRLRVYYLVRELARAGHTVDLVGYDDASAPVVCDIASHCRRMERVHMDDIEFRNTRTLKNLMRFLRASLRGYPHRVQRMRTKEMPTAVSRMISEGEYDIVQFSEVIIGSVYESVAEQLRSRNIPVVFDFIDAMSASMLRSLRGGISVLSPVRLISGLLLRRYESWIIRSVQAATFVSARDRRFHDDPPNVHVIPNGVDIPADEPERKRDIDVLFVGNFETASNCDAMLWFLRDTWPRVRILRQGSTLTVVGPHPPQSILEHAAVDVTVTGEVPSTDSYYRRAKLVVAPMRFGAGIKNKILEAFAYALPVVATTEANDGIHAPPNAIVLADKSDRMAREISALLDDDPRRRDIAEHAHRFVQREYRWEKAAEGFIEIFRELWCGR
jgi:polysaccharide biosynthesis protein PslH